MTSLKNNSEPRIAVFAPNQSALTETFIRNHISYLPYKITARFGTELKLTNEKGELIWPFADLFARLLCKLKPSLRNYFRDELLASHLRSHGIKAVLAEYGTTGCWLEKACRKARVPLIVHFHGYDASVTDIIKANKMQYRILFSSSYALIAVSKGMVGRLLDLGAPKKKIHLIPYGVDANLFKQVDPLLQPQQFLAVGRLVEKKAPYLTLLAFERVLRKCPEAFLIVVGEGPLMGPCKRIAEALGISDSVSFMGTQTSDVVATLMRSSRAFVQHSIKAENGDSEGTPVAVIEAQMSGLPVVATNHEGIPDVVEDRVTGFIVDEVDIEGMASALIQLAEDPCLASRMGAAARRRATKYFNLSRYIKEVSLVINSGIESKRLYG